MYTTCLKINKHSKQPGRNEGGRLENSFPNHPCVSVPGRQSADREFVQCFKLQRANLKQ